MEDDDGDGKAARLPRVSTGESKGEVIDRKEENTKNGTNGGAKGWEPAVRTGVHRVRPIPWALRTRAEPEEGDQGRRMESRYTPNSI